MARGVGRRAAARERKGSERPSPSSANGGQAEWGSRTRCNSSVKLHDMRNEVTRGIAFNDEVLHLIRDTL